MMFRPVPDSLLHFADPTIPGLSGRDLIGRRIHTDDRGAPEPEMAVRRTAGPRVVLSGRIIPLARHRQPTD